MVGQELSEPNACGESVRLHIIGYLAIFVEARSSVTCSRVVHSFLPGTKHLDKLELIVSYRVMGMVCLVHLNPFFYLP